MVEALCDKMAPWMAGNGPETSVAVCCQGNLLRNLADFPFPSACSPEEEAAVLERAHGALDSCGLLARGQYRTLAAIECREAYCLAEKRLMPVEMVLNRKAGALYQGDDQCTSVAINGTNHVCIGFLASGLQLDTVWTSLDSLDDSLARAVDYAFDERLGYLTSSISHVGTGLKLSVLLHLPGLAMSNGLPHLVQEARQKRQALHGLKPTLAAPLARVSAPSLKLSAFRSQSAKSRTDDRPESVSEAFYHDLSGALYGDISEAQGDLYLLTNLATLGVPEEEIVFHLRHTALDIITRERNAREALLRQEARRLEDRVMRALGIARTARLLSFAEAAGLLSSLRLGVDTGILPTLSLPLLTELLFTSQSAHLRMRLGRDCDEWTLNMERADMFRARIA